MERLTERYSDDILTGVLVKENDYITASHRLADYEDTGLSPDQIESMYMKNQELASFLCTNVDRAIELAEADKDSRLVVLPCKVGDKIYRIQKIFNDATLKSEIKVKACIVGSVSISSMMTDDMVFLPFDSIGKTVFLTREEAEKALKEEKDD